MIGRMLDINPVICTDSKKLIWNMRSLTMDSTLLTKKASPRIIHQPRIRMIYRNGLFVVLNRSSNVFNVSKVSIFIHSFHISMFPIILKSVLDKSPL